jgi:predicted TIM-barrel fold metal-dependent hydrolase
VVVLGQRVAPMRLQGHNMRMRYAIGSIVVMLATIAPVWAQDAPAVDHHQHLYSPGIAALISPPAPATPILPIDAHDLIVLLDAAGIKRSVVLSVAYIYGQPTRTVDHEYDKVKGENDWTSAQVARYPDRLIAFCGLNPLKEYALVELARCAKDPQLRRGLKLHFGNSGVDYHNPEHIQQLRRVFQAANDYRMPIVIHMRASYSLQLAYGAEEAQIFLRDLAPAAPDVVIQIAHMGGGGAPGDAAAQAALGAFADAVARGEPATKNLYFEVSGIGVTPRTTPDEANLVVTAMRRIGMAKILYGSDGAAGGNPPPVDAWTAFRQLPLTSDEVRTIARNVAPYFR